VFILNLDDELIFVVLHLSIYIELRGASFNFSCNSLIILVLKSNFIVHCVIIVVHGAS
jgi:hypothetical protein